MALIAGETFEQLPNRLGRQFEQRFPAFTQAHPLHWPVLLHLQHSTILIEKKKLRGLSNQRTDSCRLSSRPGVRGLFSASCIKGSSLDIRGCSAGTLSRYVILCESRGQRALNGSVLLLVRFTDSAGVVVSTDVGCCSWPFYSKLHFNFDPSKAVGRRPYLP